MAQMAHEFSGHFGPGPGNGPPPVAFVLATVRREEAEQGFIGAPEYGQAGVTTWPDPFRMTADLNHPEREKTS